MNQKLAQTLHLVYQKSMDSEIVKDLEINISKIADLWI